MSKSYRKYTSYFYRAIDKSNATLYNSALYERDLIKDIKSECNGDFERILVAVASAGREKEEEVDYELAKKEAKVKSV